ncbi:MAG: FG-GAP repeat protein [Bacteroidetes bacterium]|nr:FG-GAP repeat protein [Bacteroidota bacterium]
MNNDGYSDLIIGAIQYNGIATNVGAAFIYHGSPTGIRAVQQQFCLACKDLLI